MDYEWELKRYIGRKLEMLALPQPQTALGSLHAILAGFPIALFSGGLAADIAYLRTAEIQWTNFAAWLNAGALASGGVVLAWALLALFLDLRGPDRHRRFVYGLLLAAMWILGLINAFKHSQDGWSSVGAVGLILSIVCTLLAFAAGFVLHYRVQEASR